MANKDTIYLGLLGNPVAHSYSPLMHNAVFNKLNIKGFYLPFKVSSEQLHNAILGLQALGFKGVNVTVPHKEAVIPFLDKLSPEAQLYQAVNVVSFTDYNIIGYNTDGPGFIAALQAAGVDQWEHCLLLGAGGAARSISLALAQKGAGKITILDIDEAKAGSLAEHISQNTSVFSVGKASSAKSWTEAAREADLIVNCTPLGMYPRIEESPVESLEEISDKAIVCDIIYNPLDTKFLTLARQRGLTTVNGLDMFVYQGALTLNILLGIDAPVQFMKEVVRGELQQQGSNPN
jgi:shikimate dehydrogenase